MSPAPSLAPGATFAGDYTIIAPLSAGGMGSVYVAEHRFTGQRCALKLMHPDLVRDPGLRQRFEQEARVGARIQSEHVVRVQGAGVDTESGAPWIAMELLAGADLERVMRARGRLPPSEVRAVFEDLCHAVGAAHRAGIVHRDLKPPNVFWADAQRTGARFTIKVLDFGIAKALAHDAPNANQRAGITHAGLGTPLWMAPEQIRNEPVSPATDVWALGLLAFHLLTGGLYWRATSDPTADVRSLFQEVLVSPLPSASQRAAELGASLPAGFDAWFACCVARDPRARFADADACFRALAPSLGAGVASASSPAIPPGPPPYALASTSPAASAAATPALTPTRVPSVATMVAGGLVAVVLVVGASVATVLAVARPKANPAAPPERSAERPADRADDRRPDRPATPTPTPCATERCLPFQIADPTRVDATDLIPAARRAGRVVDPTASLGRVSVSGANEDGTVDITGRNWIAYQFIGKTKIFLLQTSGLQFAVARAAQVWTTPLPEGAFCSARAAVRGATPRLPAGAPILMAELFAAANGGAPTWQVITQKGLVMLDGRTCAPR